MRNTIVFSVVCVAVFAAICVSTATPLTVPAEPAAEDPEARILINWTVKPPGQQISDYFPTRPPLRIVKILVLNNLGLPGTDADSYVVINMNGVILDDEKNLLENGVRDGDRLILTW